MKKQLTQSHAIPYRHLGFTLVEVLVAVIILGVGLLGLAGLQVSSLHFNRSAYFRAQATMMAYDIAERMKANPQGFTNGNYNNQAGGAVGACLEIAGCTPAEMAQNDLDEWVKAMEKQLPGGKGAVCMDSTPNDGTYENLAGSCDGVAPVYVIKIAWQEERAKGGQEEKKEIFETSFQP